MLSNNLQDRESILTIVWWVREKVENIYLMDFDNIYL